MRRILVPPAVTVVAAVCAAAAYGQLMADTEGPATPVGLLQTQVQAPVRQTASARVLPPIRLPSIKQAVAQLRKADRSVSVRQQAASSRVLGFWAGKHQWLLAKRHTACSEVPWARSCTIARHSQRMHQALLAEATYRVDHEIPLINDWRTAVHWVQRIYPGTEQWMLYISDREGGWGRWVWYGGRGWNGYHVGDDFLGADTVGGWAQFRYSTFAPYWRQAQADLKRRGYIVPFIPMPPEGGPSKYAAWLSPLGQALTMAYMKYYGKEGCHWCL